MSAQSPTKKGEQGERGKGSITKEEKQDLDLIDLRRLVGQLKS